MTCRETEDALGAYGDGNLAPERTLQLEAHLRHCPVCTAELRGMRAGSGLRRAGRWPLVLLAAAACVAAFWILGTR